jgi:hypothetical protein
MNTEELTHLTRQAVRNLLQARHDEHADVKGERRHTTRWPFPGTIEIHALGAPEQDQTFATCRNLSETGLGMSCDQFFDPESILEIAVHLPEATFLGRAVVRYCMKTPRGYMTGIEFQFPD